MTSDRTSNLLLAQAIITPGFLVKVEKLLATVQYISTVCKLLSLPRRTFYVWKRTGMLLRNEMLPDDILTPRARLLIDFYNAVERGLAQGELADLKIIEEATTKNWRAAAWRLAHRAPQRWSEKRKPRVPDQRQAEQLADDTRTLLRELREDCEASETQAGSEEPEAYVPRPDIDDDTIDHFAEHGDAVIDEEAAALVKEVLGLKMTR